jgi:ATP-dependent Zn protease
MLTNILIGVLSFLAGIIVVLLFLRRSSRPKPTNAGLNRFNFDKQKKYEKDGRKYPFSY